MDGIQKECFISTKLRVCNKELASNLRIWNNELAKLTNLNYSKLNDLNLTNKFSHDREIEIE